MKTILLICATLVLLALIDQTSADAECDSGDNYFCARKCFQTVGSHGECDAYGTCNCSTCIYFGCRQVCRRRGKIAQCQNDRCACLS